MEAVSHARTVPPRVPPGTHTHTHTLAALGLSQHRSCKTTCTRTPTRHVPMHNTHTCTNTHTHPEVGVTTTHPLVQEPQGIGARWACHLRSTRCGGNCSYCRRRQGNRRRHRDVKKPDAVPVLKLYQHLGGFQGANLNAVARGSYLAQSPTALSQMYQKAEGHHVTQHSETATDNHLSRPLHRLGRR